MSSTASVPSRDRLLRRALWGGAVAMCAVPKVAPCARALFTVGVIAQVGKDVGRLREEARALREETARLRANVEWLAGEWIPMSYWKGRVDERENPTADLENRTADPIATAEP